jgi:ABC-type lipoprotein export system ATPase subunit
VRATDEIALTGRSGSGKSTLLHLLAALDHPTTGTLEWPTIPPDGRRPPSIAMVFQSPSLLEPLDVVENVALPLVLAGASVKAAAIAAGAALDRLGLLDLAHALPLELSGGQAQRVAVARAIAGHPLLLLADEPTGQLDHASAADVIDALLEARRSGAAVVVATHDAIVARRFATQWTMVDGRLETGAEAVAWSG